MKRRDHGKFSDNLVCKEVEFSKECANKLKNKSQWRKFLNSHYIKDAIEIIRDPSRSMDQWHYLKE